MPIPRYAPDESLMRMLEAMLSGMPELGELQQPPKPFGDYVDESVQQYEPQGPSAGWTGPEQDIGSVGIGDQTSLAASADIGIAGREDAATAKASEAAAQVQQLKEAAKQAQLDELSSLEGMPADKLWNIRAQARAKGSHGSLGHGDPVSSWDYEVTKEPTGGAFSDPSMTPELQQRLDDRDAWLAGAPIRDATFQSSPEMARRDPKQAAFAGENLVRLQAARAQEQKLANETALVEAVGNLGGGKIPFDLSSQMQVAGMSVPHELRGMDPETAKMQISQIMSAGAENMTVLQNSPMSLADPDAAATASYLKFVEDTGKRYMDLIDRGAPVDQIIEQYMKLVQQQALQSGAAAYWERIIAQRQAPPEGQ